MATPRHAGDGRAPDAAAARADDLDHLAATLLSACIEAFAAHRARALAGDDDAVAVHRMRVALRRLRTLLQLFARAWPCPAFPALRAEARRIAGELGEARERDVLALAVKAGPLAAWPDHPGFGPLAAAIAAAGREAHGRARTMLDEPGTRAFLAAAEAVVADRAWRRTAPAGRPPRPRAFARHCLARLHRRVRRAGRALDGATDRQVHDLRILAKRLRYAAEAFGPLFDGRQARAYAAAAARLQEALGAATDAAALRDHLAALATGGTESPALAEARGIALGWFARAATLDRRSLRRAVKALEKEGRFWE